MSKSFSVLPMGLLVGIVIVGGLSPFAGHSEVILFLSTTAIITCGRARSGRHPIYLTAACGWMLASVLWSSAPALTLSGATSYLAMSVALWWLTGQLGRRATFRALAVAFKVLVVINFATYAFFPDVGRVEDTYHNGALEGLTLHRNLAAFSFVLAVVMFGAGWLARGSGIDVVRAPRLWGLLSILCLLLTESGTGVLCAGIGLLALLALTRLRSERARRWLLGVSAILGAAAVLVSVRQLGAVTDIFGRDTTLTGRTDIWMSIVPFIQMEPWLGYGWSALWTGGVPVTEAVWARGGFRFYHAHNAYLDAALQLGIVGLALILTLLLGVMRRLLQISKRPGRFDALGLASCVIVLIVYGATEQSFMTLLGWTILVVAARVSSMGSEVASRAASLVQTER